MKKVIAYVHTHWDREWYRDFQEFRLRLIEVVDKVIKDLESGDMRAFFFDAQTAALEDYLEIFPERSEKIKQLISDKKLYIGPFYCSTDSFLTSAESMIRNLYFGIKKSKEYGCNDYIGYLADTFGHSVSVNHIFKHYCLDKAMLWRGLGDLPADLDWHGIQTTNMIQGYFQDFLSLDIDIEKKAEFIKNYIDKIAAKSGDYILLPIGADHLATPDKLKSQIEKLNEILEDYEIEVATPFEYFDAVKNVRRTNVEGEFLDNSMTFILPAVYSSRIYLKKANALTQWSIARVAEPMQAISSFAFNKESRQNQIDYAYKTLIKNHAHDSIYGCSIDKVHYDVMSRFSDVDAVCNGVIKRCQRDLSGSDDGVSVLNLSNYKYSGAIRIETTKELPDEYNAVLIGKRKGFSDELLYNPQKIPVTEDYTDINTYLIDVKELMPFSIKTLSKQDLCSENNLRATDNVLENKNIKLEIKNSKILLVDKISNKIYEDFINIIDRADIGDSYNFGALKSDKKIVAELVSSKLVENNSVRSVLALNYEILIPKTSNENGRAESSIRHNISVKAVLYNQSKYIEFETAWENKSKNHILQLEFNLDNLITSTVSEDALGLIERKFDPDYSVYAYLNAPRGKELKTNTAAMQRFVWAQNIGVITQGLNEYEIAKNKLRVTILRATGTISNPKNPTRGTPAGPPLETPKLQCLGENSVKFALCFEKEPNALFNRAEEFYGCTVSLQGKHSDTKFFNLDNENILVYALKLCGNDLVIRLFNTSEKEQKTTINSYVPISKIEELTPIEETICEIKNEIFFSPNELKTIKLVKEL